MRFWLEKDIIREKVLDSFVVVLRTTGCRWRRCSMCSYWMDSSAKASQDDILREMESSLEELDRISRERNINEVMLKIYTSGSFLDEKEVHSETRKRILKEVEDREIIKKVVVETRPEFVERELIKECVDRLEGKIFEVAIGLETSDDLIRTEYIRKGFSFSDFVKAAHVITEGGASLRTYLLLKPPFMSEKEAIKDVVRSSERVSKHVKCDTISINLCNIQKETFLEWLWKRGYYRPPWLWSAVECLSRVKKSLRDRCMVISSPPYVRSRRVAHNCGRCDRAVSDSIRRFSLTQDISELDKTCGCKHIWMKMLELEDHAYMSILA